MQDIYEKNYTNQEPEEKIETNDTANGGELTLWEIYKIYTEDTPKHIVPEDQANYDYLLKRCDELAQKRHGYLYGYVDYETYGAKIKVTLPHFIKFSSNDDLFLLKEIADKARSVLFEPAADDSFVMSIFINYFAEDESFNDYFARVIKNVIQQRGLTLEAAAAQCGVDLVELIELLGEPPVIRV